MLPFDHCFPDCAAAERLVLRVQKSGTSLPLGEYDFFEWFCEIPGCDCRRALLQVKSPQRPGEILATINFGWESEEFYTKWMHGDARSGREIARASLDPVNPNSELSAPLLAGFRDYIRHDPLYPQQLRRHYEMFKSDQTPGPEVPASPEPGVPMTPAEIIRQLQHLPYQCDFAPYEAALLAAADQREAVTPELIAALDRVAADPAHYLKHHEDSLHLFAIYLLAQFRETRALDSLVHLFSLPEHQTLDLTGDMITISGAAILASVCGGDPAPLLRLARDESVNEYVRGQAITGLLVQSVWGERPREAVIADLRALFAGLPKPGIGYLWAELATAVRDFNALELLPEVRQAFAEELVDESFVGLDEIDPDMEPLLGFPPPVPEEDFRLFCERNGPVDAIAECSDWICFGDGADESGFWDKNVDMDEDEDWDDSADIVEAIAPAPVEPYYDLPPTPYVAPPKTGRNEPCPCGSGKKYKKCCGK